MNSSLAQFFTCLSASEDLWELEAANRIAREARGELLESRIRAIDPAALVDKEGPWAALVEEVRAGVV